MRCQSKQNAHLCRPCSHFCKGSGCWERGTCTSVVFSITCVHVTCSKSDGARSLSFRLLVQNCAILNFKLTNHIWQNCLACQMWFINSHFSIMFCGQPTWNLRYFCSPAVHVLHTTVKPHYFQPFTGYRGHVWVQYRVPRYPWTQALLTGLEVRLTGSNVFGGELGNLITSFSKFLGRLPQWPNSGASE